MNTFHSTNGSEQNHKDENESDRHTSDLSCKSRSPSQDAIYPVDKDGPANSSPLYDIYSDISDSDNNSNTSTSSHKNSTVEDIDLLKSVLTSHLPIPKVLDPQSASSSPRISPPAATHTPPTFTKKPPVPKRRPDAPDIFDMFYALNDPETKTYDRSKLREIVRFKSTRVLKPNNMENDENLSGQLKNTTLDGDTPLADKQPTETIDLDDQDSDEEIPDDVLMASFKQDIALLYHTFRYARRIVVIAGAGISVAAGIPDFRSTTGLFRLIRNDLKLRGNGAASGQQMFDASVVFSDDQALSNFHSTMCDLHELCSKCNPTPFHTLVNSVSQDNRLLRLYTQNIDCLDAKMPYLKTKHPLVQPWPKTVQLHGTISDIICTKCSWTAPFDPALFKTTNVSTDRETNEGLSNELARQNDEEGQEDDVVAIDTEEDLGLPKSHLGTFDQIKAHFGASDETRGPKEDCDSEVDTIIEDLHIPECPECIELDDVRQVAGKRSQGVGKLRPKIVLYNEPNPDSEAIGQITEHDLLKKPDGLIVVGTTLKIPGVRRMVREMSQAVHAARGVSIWMNIDDPSVLSSREFESCFDLIIKGDCQKVGQILDDYEDEKRLFEEFQVQEREQRKKVLEMRRKQREQKLLEKKEQEKQTLKAKEQKASTEKKKKTNSALGSVSKKSGSQNASNTNFKEKKGLSKAKKNSKYISDASAVSKVSKKNSKSTAKSKTGICVECPTKCFVNQPKTSANSEHDIQCESISSDGDSKDSDISKTHHSGNCKKKPKADISKDSATTSKPAPKQGCRKGSNEHPVPGQKSVSSGTSAKPKTNTKMSLREIKVANTEREVREELEEHQAKEQRKQQGRLARNERAHERKKRLLFVEEFGEIESEVIDLVEDSTNNGQGPAMGFGVKTENLTLDSDASVATKGFSKSVGAQELLETVSPHKPLRNVMAITSILIPFSDTNCSSSAPEQQENVTDIEIPLKRKHSYPDQVRDTGDAFSECVSVSAPPSFGSVYSQASQTSPSTAKPQPGSVSREPHGAWISPPCSQSLQQQGTAAGQMANTISSLPSADAGPR